MQQKGKNKQLGESFSGIKYSGENHYYTKESATKKLTDFPVEITGRYSKQCAKYNCII